MRHRVRKVVNCCIQPISSSRMEKPGNAGVVFYTDFIVPAQEREPIIDCETWQASQDKLANKTKRAKAPRNPNLWLAGLVVSAGCKLKMTGFVRSHGKERYNLACTHHKQYGEDHADWARRQRAQYVRGHERLIAYGERGCHGFVRRRRQRHRGRSIRWARRSSAATVRRGVPAHRER